MAMKEISFSENLKALRKEQKLTQKQLSEELGVALSTVAMWETGARQPDYDKLNKIAAFFNVSHDALLIGPKEDGYDSTGSDSDIMEIRDLLRTRPEMKMLFSVSKNATRADIERTVAIIEALKNQQ